MERAADENFCLAMRRITETVYQRRAARSFRGEHRVELELRADETSKGAMSLVSVSADTAQGQG